MEIREEGMEKLLTIEKTISGMIELHRLVVELKELESQHQRTIELLRANEKKYRTFLENVPLKLFIKDRNCSYLYCNENYARDLNIRAEEILGKTDFDFFGEEMARKYTAEDNKILETGQPETSEEEYASGGQKCTVQMVKTPIRDEKNNIIGLLGIFWDITEQKEKEEESQKYREHLEGLLSERSTELQKTQEHLQTEIQTRERVEDELRNTATELQKSREHMQSEIQTRGRVEDELRNTATELQKTEEHLQSEIQNRQTVEEHLRNTVQRLDTLWKTGAAVAVMDEEDMVLDDMNVEFERLFGITKGNGHKLADFSIAGDVDQLKEYVATRKTGQASEPGESIHVFTDKQGNRKVLSVKMAPIPETKKWVVSLSDLTEKHRLEAALADSQEKFLWLVENSAIAISVIQDGAFKFINAKGADILGYPQGELISRSALEFIRPEDREGFEVCQKTLEDSGIPHAFSFRIVQKDGKVRWLEDQMQFIHWEGKGAILNVWNDITGSKEALEQFTKSVEPLRSVVNAIDKILPYMKF